MKKFQRIDGSTVNVPTKGATRCKAFVTCTREATTTIENPILGAVPSCQACADKLSHPGLSARDAKRSRCYLPKGHEGSCQCIPIPPSKARCGKKPCD